MCDACTQVVPPIREKVQVGALPNPMAFAWGAPHPGPPVKCSGCDKLISGLRLTFPDGRREWQFHHPHSAAVWHVLWRPPPDQP